jgi:uncharacterized protein YpiB (UPF0302 family)
MTKMTYKTYIKMTYKKISFKKEGFVMGNSVYEIKEYQFENELMALTELAVNNREIENLIIKIDKCLVDGNKELFIACSNQLNFLKEKVVNLKEILGM